MKRILFALVLVFLFPLMAQGYLVGNNPAAVSYYNHANNMWPMQTAEWKFQDPEAEPSLEVLHRINAGGLAYTDSLGQEWSADFGYNTGYAFKTSNTVTGTTDPALYQSERWDPSGGEELRYSLPLADGTYVVRLHFADIYSGTNQPGKRAFDISIEGLTVLEDLDVVAEVGPLTARDVTFTVDVADGVLDIEFFHKIENPKVNAIEVFSTGGPPITPAHVMDEDGWPAALVEGQKACALVLRTESYPRVNGEEVLEWELSWTGKGEFWIWPNGNWLLHDASEGYSAKSWGHLRYSGEPVPEEGSTLITSNHSGGAGVSICLSALDPEDPLRNITMLPAPGVYNPEGWVYDPYGWVDTYVEEQKKYPGYLRTLGMMRVNDCHIEHWEDRPLPTDASYADPCGVPLELVVDLSNRTNRPLWLNVHYRADNDYIRQMALLIRDNLNPNLKIALEYANEACWGGFPAQKFILGCFNYGSRSRFIHDTFVEILGEARVVRLLAGQACCTWPGEQAFLGYGDPDLVEAYAIAPYMCGSLRYGQPPYFETPPTVDQIIASCDVDKIVDLTIERCGHFRERYPGVECWAYESGQHIVGRYPFTPDKPDWTGPMREAQSDPRMAAIH